MNKISLWSFNYFIINNPLWKSYTYYRTRMDLKSIFCSYTAVSTITLKLCNIHKISTHNTSQYSLMHISRWLNLIKFLLLLFIVSKFISHHLLSWWESIKLFYLILKFMINFDCMFHRVVTNFHLLTRFFLLIMFSI